MGFASYQEDNQDARDESLRRFSSQQTKKTEKEPTVSKSKKSRRPELMKSQFRLRRSPDSTRVNRVARRKKKSQSKSKKSRRPELMKSQFRLRRSPDSTRVNRVARRKKKSQSKSKKSQWTRPKNLQQTQPKKSRRLTPDDIQQYLLGQKGKPFLTVSDWVIDIHAYFEKSDHILLPQQEPLHRFVRLALNYLKRSRDAAEDAEGRWKII